MLAIARQVRRSCRCGRTAAATATASRSFRVGAVNLKASRYSHPPTESRAALPPLWLCPSGSVGRRALSSDNTNEESGTSNLMGAADRADDAPDGGLKEQGSSVVRLEKVFSTVEMDAEDEMAIAADKWDVGETDLGDIVGLEIGNDRRDDGGTAEGLLTGVDDTETWSDGEDSTISAAGLPSSTGDLPAPKDLSEMRLSRRIARSGIASRREAERLVAEGVVTVNGMPVLTPALNVGPNDIVKVKGHSLGAQEDHVVKLWMVHKLKNELVTRVDPAGRPTIFARLAKLKLPDTLMPVGRLDYNTEGLLLLTNDGDLARKMELPSSSIVRTYSVRVYGNITEEKLKAMRSGCTIEGVRYKGMFVRVEGGGGKGREGRNAWLTIECTEGKNRQIRKICKHLCLTVNRLARTRYGPFSLGKVRAGGVSRLDIPEAFLRRLDAGTAGNSPGGRGGKRRNDSASPGPGSDKRREGTYGGRDSAGFGRGVGGSRGRGVRIRKGVGAPMSRGDNASRRRAQRA